MVWGEKMNGPSEVEMTACDRICLGLMTSPSLWRRLANKGSAEKLLPAPIIPKCPQLKTLGI